jgi:hypothetical protein
MYDIKASRKMGEGIIISYEENGTNKYESYNFQDLLDLKINSLDLLDRPMSYRVDPAAHRIIVKK